MSASPRLRPLVPVVFAAVWSVLAAGCTSLRPCPTPGEPVPEIPATEIDASLFLLGDAGEPLPGGGEPVLEALRGGLAAAEEAVGTERVAVVFLGDNIYPAGLPDADHRHYDEYRAKLHAQVEAVANGPAASRPVAYFVPGNHDWHHNRAHGWQRIRNQEAYVEEHGDGRAAFVPDGGCPGPEVVDVGERLRIVLLDTQWWLRTGPKPEGYGSGCAAGSEEEVLELLGERLASAGERRVVVAAHHPLITGGPHGGETCAARGWLKIPQDTPGRRYREMKERLVATFADHPPLVFAAGHDHDLQLLRGDGYGYQVVSGSGSLENLTEITALDETLFCRDASGYVRLDVARDGRVRLAVFAVDEASHETSEVYSAWLGSSPTGL